MLAQIIRCAPVGLSVYDPQGPCLAVNDALAQLLGAAPEQLLAQNFRHIPSWRDSGLLEAALRCLDSGQPQTLVTRLQTSFGRQLWASVDIVVLTHAGRRLLMLALSDVSSLKQAEQAHQAARDRYQKLFAHALDGVLQTRPGGAVLAANPAACAMLGLSEQQVCQRGRDGLLDLDDPRLPALLAARARDGHARGELRMRRGDGTLFEVELTSVLYEDQDGTPLASIVFRDITERQRWMARAQEQMALLERLARHVPGVLFQFRLEADGRQSFPFVSDGIREMFELEPEAVREDATLLNRRIHPDDAAMVLSSIQASARWLAPWQLEYRVLLPRQGLRWRLGNAQPERQADGSVLWHGFITDITERKLAEVRTHQLAYFDTLTGLPNRTLLRDRIELALAHARRVQQHGALMFLDLDNFKQINDARGHSVGDRLLCEVAQRLQRLLRAEDTVARLGGDEFVLLLGELGADADAAARAAMAVAEKARAELDRPYRIGDFSYTSSGSIGITLFPRDMQQVDDLLREADTAMYRAKAAGRNRTAFFEVGMQHEVEERLALELDLQQALAQRQFELHVQDQVDATGRPVSAELLLRWHHPQRGPVAPQRFIAVAEECGLIHGLGEWVIEQACQTLVRLGSATPCPTLAVNVSVRQFRHEGFVERVRALLQRTGAPAQQLVFEVTESLFIQDWEAVLARMLELVRLGIRFSIDDFGTGYSSLAYLQRLPLSEIKIDRSFVRAVPQGANDTAIVRSILSMARHLGLEVVAEGVERAEQADFLRAHGCQRLQGYFHARPRPLAEWLAQRLAGGDAPAPMDGADGQR